MTEIDESKAIQYATPTVGKSYWPAAIFCMTGLGLIVVGGCFLIGVMIITGSASTGGLNGHQKILMMVLYCLAGCSFLGAVSMFANGVRRLL